MAFSNVKNIKGLDVILRSYQFGALEQILTNLVILIDNNKIEQDCHKLLKPLDTLFNMSDSVIKTNIQIIIINALFIKLGYPELEKMFNERINSEIYLGSKLGIKYICYTEKELESYMTYENIFTALEGAKSGEEEINMYNKSTYNPFEKQVVKRPERYLTSEEKFEEDLIEEVSGYYSFRLKVFLVFVIANIILFLILLLFFGIMTYIS